MITKFTTINTDPTNTLQITIREIINSSKSLVQEEHKWKYFSIPLPSYYKRHYQNPQTWLSQASCCKLKNAPAYELSEVFTDKINQIIFLPLKNTCTQKPVSKRNPFKCWYNICFARHY